MPLKSIRAISRLIFDIARAVNNYETESTEVIASAGPL